MLAEIHQRARLLLDRAFIEGISGADQRWLDQHIAQCPACGEYAELSRRAMQALDSFAFPLDADAALRVRETVRYRAAGMPPHGRAATIAILLTVLGSAAMWIPAEWLAHRWSVPAPAWQIAFALVWLVPSVLFDMALLLRGRRIGDHTL